MSFKDKTVFITGGSRGIGHAIGLKLAAEGARIVIAAKSIEENPRIPGTIFTAAQDMEKAGGKGLALQVDIRFEDQVRAAVDKTVKTFGGIDILINNASAIQLSSTLETDMKRYDLMHGINTRGTFMVSKFCLPHLLKAKNPHVLNLSPPLNVVPKWFGPHVAYTMAKFGMSMCVLGMAEEFKGKVAFNALWPRTTIATAAVGNILGGADMIKRSRKPEILADAAWFILGKDAHLSGNSGNFYIDEKVFASEGITSLGHYQIDPTLSSDQLQEDFFL